MQLQINKISEKLIRIPEKLFSMYILIALFRFFNHTCGVFMLFLLNYVVTYLVYLFKKWKPVIVFIFLYSSLEENVNFEVILWNKI